MDFYASYYDMNVLDRKKFLKDSAEAKDSLNRDTKAVELADCILFLNDSERNYYLGLLDCLQCVDKSRIVPLVIENHPKAYLNYYKKHSFPFNIVFCGTYIPLHGIEIILDAIKILKEQTTDFHLYMWGNQDCIHVSEKYQNCVERQGLLQYVTFWNVWDKEKYYNWCVENCACMLGVFGESEKAYTVVPNKVVDALAFGIPCITGESKGCREFFEGRLDVTLIQHNPQALAGAITELMHSNYADIEKRIRITDTIFANNFSEIAFEEKIKAVLGEFAL